MAKTKHFESEVWCPRCRVDVGKIFRVEVKENHFEYVCEPEQIPKRCSLCEGVIVRK